MTTPMHAMREELLQEAQATRRLLERVPPEKLAWRPHERSMTLGQLALHVATIPRDLTQLAQADEFDAAKANFNPPAPESAAELVAALDRSLDLAADYLAALDSAQAMTPWRLTLHGQEVFSMPRLALLRSFLLNHWYHHRGQLTVYLRLLDVPLPVIYGRTADENPFA